MPSSDIAAEYVHLAGWVIFALGNISGALLWSAWKSSTEHHQRKQETRGEKKSS